MATVSAFFSAIHPEFQASLIVARSVSSLQVNADPPAMEGGTEDEARGAPPHHPRRRAHVTSTARGIPWLGFVDYCAHRKLWQRPKCATRLVAFCQAGKPTATNIDSLSSFNKLTLIVVAPTVRENVPAQPAVTHARVIAAPVLMRTIATHVADMQRLCERTRAACLPALAHDDSLETSGSALAFLNIV